MTYSADTREAEAVCDLLNWNHGVRPIKTMRRGGKVYVTGTLLKPQEWHTLAGCLPPHLEDGTALVLTGVPHEIARSHASHSARSEWADELAAIEAERSAR